MQKSFVFTLLLIIFTFGSASASAQTTTNSTDARKDGEFQAIIPKEIWEKIYFESINERIKISKLTDLRTKALPAEDLEVRLWTGFGLTRLDGFVLKRTGGEWSAWRLKWESSKSARGKAKPVDEKLGVPKSGWEAAWQKLVDAGILTLPDAESMECSGNLNDGTSYVVEYNLKNGYRTYMFDNPQNAGCAEAKRMINISRLVVDEYYKL